MESHPGRGGSRQTDDTTQRVGQSEDRADAGVNIYTIHCSLQILFKPVMAFIPFYSREGEAVKYVNSTYRQNKGALLRTVEHQG